MSFERHFDTYEDNAIVQKEVAKELASFLKELPKRPKKILEIGCGTGLFSRQLKQNFPEATLVLNDLYDTKAYLKDLKDYDFIQKNAEELDFSNYDLITSSGSFQWFQDLEAFLEKLGKSSDQVIFSIFLKNNLKEIKEHFGVSLPYYEAIDILKMLKKSYPHIEYRQEVFELPFSSPLDALRHLQATGVTGIGKTELRKIRSYKNTSLTYSVGYFLAHR